MFAFQDTQGPVEIAFTDRHGGVSGGPFASLNLAELAGGDDPTSGATRSAATSSSPCGRSPACRVRRRPRPSYACGRCTAPTCASSTGGRRASRRPRDGLVTAEPGVAADGPGRRLRPGAARRPGGRRRRRGARRAARAWSPAWCRRAVRGDARARAPTGSRAWVGPHVCGACYEVPDAAARRGQRGRARGLAEHLVGHAVARHRRRRARPARRRRRRRSSTRRAARSRTTTCSPTAAHGAGVRPARRRWCGCAREPHRRPARDELAAQPRARCASRIADRLRARPAASADEVTLTVVTKFFPASDVRLLAELGVRHVGENRHQEAEAKARRVRRPRPDLALHRRPAEQQGGRRRGATPTWCESVDRAKLLRGLSAGRPRARPRSSTSWSRSASTRTRRRRRPRGRRPTTSTGSPSRSRRAEGLRLRGVMAVAPLGGDPRPGVRETRRDRRRRCARVDPAATWISAGHERRPRGRRRIRRDTRADRQRGAR